MTLFSCTEVIREMSYDARADIWSLGITCIELCEGHPPHYDVHPMRAIFMIPVKPAPKLKEPSKWSREMNDFVNRCLVKEVEDRATSAELMQHPWIRSDIERYQRSKIGSSLLVQLVRDNYDLILKFRDKENAVEDSKTNTTGTDENDKTLKRADDLDNSGTLKRDKAKDTEASTLKKLARNVSLRRPVLPPEASDVGASGTMVRVNPGRPNSGSYAQASGTMQFTGGVDSGTMRGPADLSSGTMNFAAPSSGLKEEAVLTELRAALKYFKNDSSNRLGGGPAPPPPASSTSQNSTLAAYRAPPDAKAVSTVRKVEMESILRQASEAQAQRLDINNPNSLAAEVLAKL